MGQKLSATSRFLTIGVRKTDTGKSEDSAGKRERENWAERVRQATCELTGWWCAALAGPPVCDVKIWWQGKAEIWVAGSKNGRPSATPARLFQRQSATVQVVKAVELRCVIVVVAYLIMGEDLITGSSVRVRN